MRALVLLSVVGSAGWLVDPVRMMSSSESLADDVDGFVAGRYADSATSVPYRLFIPRGYDRNRAYPLVIWLHGSGGIGTDNLQQIMGDQLPGTRLWTQPRLQAAQPAFVLVPQSNTGWVSHPGLQFSGKARILPGLVKSLAARYSIDADRVYLAGQSLGGAGVWAAVSSSPDLYAAAIVLCPAYDPPVQPPTRPIPVWFFVGAKDSPMIVSATRDMVAALKKSGATPRFTQYADLGHEIWEKAFAESGLAEWLYAQRRPAAGRLREDTTN